MAEHDQAAVDAALAWFDENDHGDIDKANGEVLAAAVRALRLENVELQAIWAWACFDCGARFASSVTPVELDGVTRCSKCVALEQAEAEVAALRAELDELRAEIVLRKRDRDRLRGLVVQMQKNVLPGIARGLCWCERGIGNPMMTEHSPGCIEVREWREAAEHALEGRDG